MLEIQDIFLARRANPEHSFSVRFILCTLFAFATRVVLAADAVTNSFLPAIPEGYHLQAYDDCGVEGRQPHVLMQDCYLWTFNPSDTDAGLKERSAVFGYKGIKAAYTNLDPNLSYVLALTYASDHVYNRVQSLEANGVVLHGPYALPKAKATRVIVPVPPEVTREGKMTLSWKIHGEVNATVSIIELWANAPACPGLQLGSLAGLPASLQGDVLNLTYDAVPGARITLSAPGRAEAAATNTGPGGVFGFSRSEVESVAIGGEVLLTVRQGGEEFCRQLQTTNLFFEPVHYRPFAAKTTSLGQNGLLLDGTWMLNPAPGIGVRSEPLNRSGWSQFKVPGQWLQQGFEVPEDKPVAVAKEFVIPGAWTGNRIVLRFDAIHAGTRYWLNGQELGNSENLFTPVEFDITAAAQPGQTNRLDLEMKVATLSEKLSCSSAYAFHNLGGIDRSVRLFALPPTHIRQLHVDAGLDESYRNGELRLRLVLDSGAKPENDLSLAVKLLDSDGKRVTTDLGPRLTKLEPFADARTIALVAHVLNPLKWSAEKPHLYKLVLEVRQRGALLERVERNVGFRKIEIRGRQLHVNGQRIKIAGACHHETDPLMGRAGTARNAETDVRLLKQANLNWIRTSHYPPTAELLDAADRLGMYVEVEAPFCWVGDLEDNPTNRSAVLTPISAMIDYDHCHPSVIVWSIANESYFNSEFFCATKMCKELDPTRPTTFNNPDLDGTPVGGITDIANWHYPAWPYDSLFANDPRPIYLGEYFYEVTHEQTDVQIDPGLRELWGQGLAEPDSAFGRAHTLEYAKPVMKPGLVSSGWSFLYHSDHLLGGSIWASHDDAFYFSETKHAGYAWHHGFWGLLDAWRRPKPEWCLARHIFSPVWLETRHVDFAPGRKAVRVPVENRYAFTDFSELRFEWEINHHKGRLRPRLAPAARGELEIPVPPGTAAGDQFRLRVTTPAGALIEETGLWVGKERTEPLPLPSSGAPRWREEGSNIVIRGDGFALVFDRVKGDFAPADARHHCAVISFPTVHVTRYDFGDMNGPQSPPYAVFPDAETRQFEKIELHEEASGLRLTVHEHHQDFAGSTSWLFDAQGRGVVTCNYTYSGPAMDTREAGIRFLLKPVCDEVKWRRWSEWGVFPDQSISRTQGSARAHRDARWGPARWNERPGWPWSLDETDLGTADFRSVKFNVCRAGLQAPDGSGLTLHARADAHFRAALVPNGVAAHLLWRCPLGQVTLKPGERLAGEFVVQLRP
ncbi:putative Beta-galactosidase [Verrucomicrobia bacterium]|nr:putative Beta-galactosidase [Verrucomicrobiota bacterium]